jgi:hypothetical protein
MVVRVKVLNTTFNDIIFTCISWRSGLLVAETGVPRDNHRLIIIHWRTLSHVVVSNTPDSCFIIYTLLLVNCRWTSSKQYFCHIDELLVNNKICGTRMLQNIMGTWRIRVHKFYFNNQPTATLIEISLRVPKGFNRNSQIEEKQTKQWLDEKQQTDKRWFTKYYKKDLATWTTLKTID